VRSVSDSVFRLLTVAIVLAALFLIPPELTAETDTPKPESEGLVTVHDADKAYQGLTLYPVTGKPEVHLLNMHGKILNRWHVDADRARLLPNGNLLVIHGSAWGRNEEPWENMREMIREYDWEGELVWEYKASEIVHHDLQRLPNGNTLFLLRHIIPVDEIDRETLDEKRREADIRSDSVVEIDMDGQIQWEWHLHDAADFNYCGKRSCDYLLRGDDMIREFDNWTHVNSVQLVPENKWYDAGDERFKPGNLIIMPRNWWTVIIVDRDSKKIVWEYQGDYRGGISGGHEPHMIQKGLPGEGNILIFDNGFQVHRGESFILEINPVSLEREWTYDVGKQFFSRTRGSMQRLPNGNTLISEDNTGRVFEITPDEEIVWEYKGELETSRAGRYDYDYCPQCLAFAE